MNPPRTEIKIKPQERLDIAIALCLKVHDLHETYHIVHGDIDLNNITVDQEGQVHLIDLGSAQAILNPNDRDTIQLKARDVLALKRVLRDLLTQSNNKPLSILNEYHSSPKFLMDLFESNWEHVASRIEDTPLKLAAHLICIQERKILNEELMEAEQREIVQHYQRSELSKLKVPSQEEIEKKLELRLKNDSRPLPGFETLIKNFNALFGQDTVGAARQWTPEERKAAEHKRKAEKAIAIKQNIEKAGLPISGQYPYVPSDGYHPSMPLPRDKRTGGYIDNNKNVWVKGDAHGKDRLNEMGSGKQHSEWDVRASDSLAAFCRINGYPIHNKGDGPYANISRDGKLTH